jgi:hypothetical protein
VSRFKNTWGRYRWFIEDGEHLIAESDLKRFIKYQAKSILFNCIDEDDEFLTLQYKNEVFKVKPDLYKQVDTPKFRYGDRVKLVDKPDVQAIIDDITWHSDRNEPMYFIIVNGKKRSKRYWGSDLILV